MALFITIASHRIVVLRSFFTFERELNSRCEVYC
jgi:hypothetical protein